MEARETISIVSQLWPVFTGIAVCVFFLIVWCVRLESKVMYLEKDHEENKERQGEKSDVVWTKIDSLQNTMNSVLQAFGRLEGKIDAKRDV